jgi:hypothetical protein
VRVTPDQLTALNTEKALDPPDDVSEEDGLDERTDDEAEDAGSAANLHQGDAAKEPSAPGNIPGWRVDAQIREPADTNVAVSASHVVVVANGQMMFLDKEGKTIWRGSLMRLLSPIYKAAEGIDPIVATIHHTNDYRLVYDSYHERFWMFASQCGAGGSDPTLPCRNVGVVAVSVSTIPLDGWNLYWWHGHQFAKGSPCYAEVVGSDFPMIGAGPDAVMVSIGAGGSAKTPPGTKNANGSPRYWHGVGPYFVSTVLLPSEAMAKGELASGWKYCDSSYPVSAPREKQVHRTHMFQANVTPVTSHGPTKDGRSYAVFHEAGGRLGVLGWSHLFTDQQKVESAVIPVHRFAPPRVAPQPNGVALLNNVFNDLLSAASAGDHLYTTAMDFDRVDVVHVVGIDIHDFPNLKASDVVLDEHLGNQPDYAVYPALDTNEQGTVAVVYTRVSPYTFPSIEYATHRVGDSGFGASTLLRAGESSLAGQNRAKIGASSRWGDVMGAAVDPSDRTSIWLANTYVDEKGESAIWLARVLTP